ncbi:MAG: hypothetical protein Q6370_018865 [Candidatus Sigynarchaeota archaeon]
MEKKKILVVVKAYPEPSTKYKSAICMAGITEQHEWIRLYPIDYDYFINNLNFPKFTWIEADVAKSTEKLMRKESFKVRKETIKVVDDSIARVSGSKKEKAKIWAIRKKWVSSILSPSIEALDVKWHADRTSLGVIKPNLVDLRFRKSIDEIKIEKEHYPQQTLTGGRVLVPDIIEHAISYRYRCEGSDCSTLHDQTCEDWELFEAVRNWPYQGEEKEQKIREQYFDNLKTRDLHFIVGMHSLQPTWMIIGLFYPPKEKNQDLLKFMK